MPAALAGRLLAIDAAGAACSVALLEESGHCLAARDGGDSRGAAAHLPPLAAGLLADWPGALEAVAVTTGPGGFTGLRSAIALAHGIALGRGAKLLGIPSAAVLRHGVAAPCWVALDARRPGTVFLDRAGVAESFPLGALPPPPPGELLLLGDAAEAVAAALRREGGTVTVLPGVATASRLGLAAWECLRAGRELPPPVPLYAGPPSLR